MSAFQFRPQTRAMLFGGGLATAALLAFGAAQQTNPGTVRIVQDPHPDFVVRIMEGQSYTVPAGAMLSVKSLGQTAPAGAGGGDDIVLRINGADVLVGHTDPNPVQLEMPIVAGPGDIVTVDELFHDPAVVAVALGYITRI